MKGDPVPDSDHVARYCGGSHVKTDGTISGEAFRLRKRSGAPEPYLSVNWLDLLNDDRAAALDGLREVLRRKLRVRPRARLAVLNVGEVRSYVRENSEDRRVLEVLHEPEDEDRSHSGIHNLRLEDYLIADLIAEIVKEVHPVQRP